MFGKLMKYEMKSLSRGLLPLYGAILVVAVINAFVFGTNGMEAGGWAQAIAIMLYTALCVSIAVMTLIIIVQRFYKGLLGQEGYLMFTLPVPTWQLTCSKLLGASIMFVLSGIVGVISVFILVAGMLDWAGLMAELNSVLVVDIHMMIRLVEVLVGIFVSVVADICKIYLAIALGHLANQHRVAMSIVWFIVIDTALTFIEFLLVNTGILQNAAFAMVSSGEFHMLMWIGIAATVVQAAVFYFGTNYILKNKLNLE